MFYLSIWWLLHEYKYYPNAKFPFLPLCSGICNLATLPKACYSQYHHWYRPEETCIYFDMLYFRDIMCIVVRTVLGIPGNIIQQSTKYFTPIVFSNFLPSSVSLPCTSSYYLDHNTRHQQLWCFFIQNRVPRLSLSYFMIHFLCRIFMIHFTRGFEDAANYMARRKFRNTKRTAPYYEWESLVCLQQCIYILFIQS